MTTGRGPHEGSDMRVNARCGRSLEFARLIPGYGYLVELWGAAKGARAEDGGAIVDFEFAA